MTINEQQPACRSLPREEWCDRDGAGGFMGHVCGKTPTSRARFASPEMAPIDQATARVIAKQRAQLGAYVADLCQTVDTLWTENERLQEGVDHNLGLVAELRGRLGNRAATIDPALVERLRVSVASAHHKRFLAEAIDIGDLESLLAFVDAMGSGQ